MHTGQQMPFSALPARPFSLPLLSKSWVLLTFSQYLQKSAYDDLAKLTTEVTDLAKACAADDSGAECNKPLNLFKFICDNQDTVAKKVATCCAKPELERSHCIAELEEDDKPDNLPPKTADFAEDKDVCENYAEAKDIFLGTFLYEYSRRHPEYGSLLLLRIIKAYEARLEKCCAEADPPACYGNVICYTQKIPQVSTPTLVETSNHLGKVATKCCKLSEAHKMPCVEDHLSAVLNSLCVNHEKNPVSESPNAALSPS
ncbi:Serum albumin [Sciurus carolinensis]|uniref:Albumin n=1 Tax=Sciurus carolinensis TaxID=30640 RepID=A0AA41NJT4_SCICA|nr:Serum albumin [Sciurus carolinensis]